MTAPSDEPRPTDPQADPGLHITHAPLPEPLDERRRWSPGRIALQILGMVIGLALLGWAVSLAMSDENAAALKHIRNASPGPVALLALLSATGIILNGLMFWIVLRPLHRLSALDTALTNAIAVCLAVLPFKLGLLVRVTIHHRRDGVSLKDMVAWFAAISALALAVLVPLAAAGLWRGRLDTLWWLTSAGGIVAISAAALACGRLSEHHRWLARLSLGSWRIVRHPAPIVAHGAFRIADIGVLSVRFVVAAAIAGQSLGFSDAVLFATVYFFLSAIVPTGNLGFREMGVALVASRTGLDAPAMALIALIVTAGEWGTSLVLGSIGWLRLRPDRLLWGRRKKVKPISPSEDPAACSGSA